MADLLRNALEEAVLLPDETARLLEVAAIVSDALRPLGVRPVVVGGLAVAYWSAPAYLTSDIDLLMPTDPRIDTRLQELGFQRRGRYWQHPDSGVLLEAPGSFLRAHERAEEVELASGRHLLLLSPEDALVYRLHEFVATGHSDAFAQALLLLAAPGTSLELLDAAAQRERLIPALRRLRELANEARAAGGSKAGSFTRSRANYSDSMSTSPPRTYQDWIATRPQAQAWAAIVLAALPTTSRERPRDPEKAALLREAGAPEHLTGQQPQLATHTEPIAPPPRPTAPTAATQGSPAHDPGPAARIEPGTEDREP